MPAKKTKDPMRTRQVRTSAELDDEAIVGPSRPRTIDAAHALWDRACEAQYRGLLDAKADTRAAEKIDKKLPKP